MCLRHNKEKQRPQSTGAFCWLQVLYVSLFTRDEMSLCSAINIGVIADDSHGAHSY
jgi:hypothetical protein